MFKPVKNGRVTSEYGWRVDPFHPEKKQWHPGIDIAPPKDGSDPHPEIRCWVKSQVYVLGFSQTFGNRVWVKMLEGPHVGLFMVYPHMQSIAKDLKPNMILEEGHLIGIMGSTGLSTGTHTHLEIRPSTSPGGDINPVELRAMF